MLGPLAFPAPCHSRVRLRCPGGRTVVHCVSSLLAFSDVVRPLSLIEGFDRRSATLGGAPVRDEDAAKTVDSFADAECVVELGVDTLRAVPDRCTSVTIAPNSRKTAVPNHPNRESGSLSDGEDTKKLVKKSKVRVSVFIGDEVKTIAKNSMKFTKTTHAVRTVQELTKAVCESRGIPPGRVELTSSQNGTASLKERRLLLELSLAIPKSEPIVLYCKEKKSSSATSSPSCSPIAPNPTRILPRLTVTVPTPPAATNQVHQPKSPVHQPIPNKSPLASPMRPTRTDPELLALRNWLNRRGIAWPIVASIAARSGITSLLEFANLSANPERLQHACGSDLETFKKCSHLSAAAKIAVGLANSDWGELKKTRKVTAHSPSCNFPTPEWAKILQVARTSKITKFKAKHSPEVHQPTKIRRSQSTSRIALFFGGSPSEGDSREPQLLVLPPFATKSPRLGLLAVPEASPEPKTDSEKDSPIKMKRSLSVSFRKLLQVEKLDQEKSPKAQITATATPSPPSHSRHKSFGSVSSLFSRLRSKTPPVADNPPV